MAVMERTTAYFPADLRRGVEELSRRTGRSQAEILREAVRFYLAQQERPQLRSLGIANNPEISGRDARDWLGEHWHPR